MVGFNLLARAAAIAANTTTMASFSNTTSTAITSTISSQIIGATPSATPLFQGADFSDGNVISFINTDSTARTITFTSNNNIFPISNLAIQGLQTINQSIPNDWCGNFQSVNQGLPFHLGILGEVCFVQSQHITYYDISSIPPNDNDTQGIKMLMPAVSKNPAAGCISFVETCLNSYLNSTDDRNTHGTSETELLCYVGTGMTAIPSGAVVPFGPGSNSGVPSTTLPAVSSTQPGVATPLTSAVGIGNSSTMSPLVSTASGVSPLTSAASIAASSTPPPSSADSLNPDSSASTPTPYNSPASIPAVSSILPSESGPPVSVTPFLSNSNTLPSSSPASNTPYLPSSASNTPSLPSSASNTPSSPSPASNTPSLPSSVSNTPSLPSSASNTPSSPPQNPSPNTPSSPQFTPPSSPPTPSILTIITEIFTITDILTRTFTIPVSSGPGQPAPTMSSTTPALHRMARKRLSLRHSHGKLRHRGRF